MSQPDPGPRATARLAAVAALSLAALLLTVPLPVARAATGPTVTSVTLLPLTYAGGVNPLLRQQAEIYLGNATWELGVTGYEWAWADKANAAAPTSPVMRDTFSPKGQEGVHISYYWTRPNTKATLFVRGVDPTGTGPWYRYPQAIQTPKVPVVVGLGDSATSGHHRDAGETSTHCWDPDYSYARRVVDRVNAYLPSQWKALYVNDAESGFSTIDVIHGGRDACNQAWSSPLRRASKTLQAHSPSWNQVLVSVGVDDTNWAQVVAHIVEDGVVLPPGNEDVICSARIAAWDGWDALTQSSLTHGVQRIYSTLHQADGTATFYPVGYWNPSGSGYVADSGALFDGRGPMFPAACASDVDKAIATLHAATMRGIAASGAVTFSYYSDKASTYVDTFEGTGQVVSLRADLYQALQLNLLDRFVFQHDGPPPGWPHLNRAGAKMVADELPLMIWPDETVTPY